jgi:hypothetical protein
MSSQSVSLAEVERRLKNVPTNEERPMVSHKILLIKKPEST